MSELTVSYDMYVHTVSYGMSVLTVSYDMSVLTVSYLSVHTVTSSTGASYSFGIW